MIRTGLESILALNKVIEDNQNVDLTEWKSENNIIDNLVVVAGFNGVHGYTDRFVRMKLRSSGTGLKLTTDGFILTAYHNIRKYEEDWKKINAENPPTQANIDYWIKNMKMKYAIIDKKKKAYPIDTSFWETNPNLDIALIKAIIPEEPMPIKFRILTDELKAGDEVKLLGLRNQRQYNQYGRVIFVSRNARINNAKTGEVVSTTHDTFFTDAYGVPGFSGGAFTTLHGEFAGLSLYIEKNINNEIGYAGGAKMKNIIDFIKTSVDKLNKSF